MTTEQFEILIKTIDRWGIAISLFLLLLIFSVLSTCVYHPLKEEVKDNYNKTYEEKLLTKESSSIKALGFLDENGCKLERKCNDDYTSCSDRWICT